MSNITESESIKRNITILCIDDEPSVLNVLKKILQRDGYDVLSALNGKKALAHLHSSAEKVKTIILDRFMPEMDGIEFCKVIKSENSFKHIPIIMLTGARNIDQISEGINAGVFYYLTKPIQKTLLLSIISRAVTKAQQHEILIKEELHLNLGFGLVQHLKLSFKTLEEAQALSSFLSNMFPEKQRVFVGISELLINSVEHGNLEISYEEKGHFLTDNSLDRIIKERLNDPHFASRETEVIFNHKEGCYSLQITDEGNGFNWRDFLEFSPSRADDVHGRGIAMAKLLSFDDLVYNEKGNQVTAIVYANKTQFIS